MSLRKMVNKIKNIILGTYYNIFNKNNDIAKPRLRVCSKCDQKKYIWKLGYICKECGCILKSKTTVKNEKCPLNKWL